ncbi:unnamed protein product [Discosporangium mesarthrocarpum]
MSWFGTNEPAAPAGPSTVDLAKQEMEMYSDLFAKMSNLCFKKCVVKMAGEADLTVGEMTCVDRCVAKYMETQEKVGVILKKAEEGMQAQAQAATQAGAAVGAPRR